MRNQDDSNPQSKRLEVTMRGSGLIWTVVGILAIIALIIFIF